MVLSLDEAPIKFEYPKLTSFQEGIKNIFHEGIKVTAQKNTDGKPSLKVVLVKLAKKYNKFESEQEKKEIIEVVANETIKYLHQNETASFLNNIDEELCKRFKSGSKSNRENPLDVKSEFSRELRHVVHKKVMEVRGRQGFYGDYSADAHKVLCFLTECSKVYKTLEDDDKKRFALDCAGVVLRSNSSKCLTEMREWCMEEESYSLKEDLLPLVARPWGSIGLSDNERKTLEASLPSKIDFTLMSMGLDAKEEAKPQSITRQEIEAEFQKVDTIYDAVSAIMNKEGINLDNLATIYHVADILRAILRQDYNSSHLDKANIFAKEIDSLASKENSSEKVEFLNNVLIKMRLN